MVIDFNRIFIGLIIVLSVLFGYFFNQDYLILLIIFAISFFDLYKSKFINSTYDYIFLFIFFICALFIVFNYKLIEYLNIFLFISLALCLFKPNFYPKKFFLISILIFLLNFIYTVKIDRETLYFVFFISFYNDTLAYFFGRLLKGPLIVPNISPKKTWSGTVLSFIASFILIYYLNYPLYITILLSISLFLGDIIFSFVKRKNKIKDFSNILGGHGGALDRLDSMFLFIVIINYYI